jgi:hypothetical protein
VSSYSLQPFCPPFWFLLPEYVTNFHSSQLSCKDFTSLQRECGNWVIWEGSLLQCLFLSFLSTIASDSCPWFPAFLLWCKTCFRWIECTIYFPLCLYPGISK